MRYRLNTPDVIAETVEGEALIIHTPSGVYHSVEGAGERIWNALLSGHTPDEIAAAFDAGEIPADSALAAVRDFARQLEANQLLVARDEADSAGILQRFAQPFSAPVLETFTDMRELLLVDPIHEVDPEAGWPRRPQNN